MAKKYKNRDEKRSTQKKKSEENLKAPSYFNYISGILLLAIFTLSFYLRAIMPYDSVFMNGVVAFASDDAVFHMRLVENTLYNFPNQIVYDAFTIYPVGSTIHWGPLFTQMIATLSLFAGLGSTNLPTVNAIGAFFPAILGAFVVFPVYYIGKSIGNRSTGLLAALLIAILPGQFFQRSVLGFTDNHVAEVLFSTATIAFFILSLKSGREKNIKFPEKPGILSVLSGIIIHFKDKAGLLSIFAGIMLAAYQLSWPGAPFFGMIISIAILIQYILDDMRGRSTDYIAVAAVPMFLISLIFVSPYINPDYGFSTNNYSWFHVMAALGGMVLPIALSLVSRYVKERGEKPYYYPLYLGGFFIAGMLIMKFIIPQMFNAIMGAPNLIFEVHTGGGNTIGEAQPTFDRPGQFWGNFPITGFLQGDIVSLLILAAVSLYIGYRITKKQRAEDMLILVWTIVMFIAVYGQNRWSYYFAVNAALLAGVAGGAIIDTVLISGGWRWKIDSKSLGIYHIFSLVIAIFVVFFFTYPSAVATVFGSNGQPPISKWGGGDPSGGGFAEWHETLTWMRDNTPDPGIDYLAIYKDPKNGTYPYPDTAYGVMSWWDYGHIITYWAHRIPNANPFQAGIGGGPTHAPGAASFLTAKSEEEADNILYALGINGKPGARYIMSNAYMAYQIMDIFGVWNEDYAPNEIPGDPYYATIRTQNGMQRIPSLRYYDNMEAKLHIFDGNGLKRYRLVHESAQNPYSDEQMIKNVYNILYKGNIPVENSGLVKVFEFVKGANITGRAPAGSTVTLTNTIKTNIGRTIPYSQTTTAINGTYVFTVPYSTTGTISGQTNFDTMPTGPYNLTAGNLTKQVPVDENFVLNGGTVTLDLI
ncbi:Dolichyl-monophosphooligosaccharide--protein glycotransferase AglB [uncultured archaeon]|nr:Dolichyl-monophosphooligosaccharide--protein glycotransferase AglB [uncultured archaeon]